MLPPSPFTKSEALDFGISEYDWRVLVRLGEVRELLRGIYADAVLPDTLELRIKAVARVLPDDVVLAQRTAAWVYGVDALDPRGHPTTPPLDLVTVERVRRPKHRLAAAHAADDLTDDDVVERGGVQLTSPLRTACDLGRFLPPPQALGAIDALLHAGLVTKGEMTDQVPCWRRRRGVRQLERMIDLGEPACESQGESRMRLQIIDGGLPRPEVQIPIYDLSGRERYRLDAGYRRHRVGAEYDGEEFHGPEEAEADRRRREWIRARGWQVEAFREEHVYRRTLVVAQTVRRMLAGG